MWTHLAYLPAWKTPSGLRSLPGVFMHVRGVMLFPEPLSVSKAAAARNEVSMVCVYCWRLMWGVNDQVKGLWKHTHRHPEHVCISMSHSADTRTFMHANTAHMCTHMSMHIPQPGTKHQADDLPPGCYCWKGFWNHLGQPLILYRRGSLQPREGNSAKGIPLRELMAESNPNKPTTNSCP